MLQAISKFFGTENSISGDLIELFGFSKSSGAIRNIIEEASISRMDIEQSQKHYACGYYFYYQARYKEARAIFLYLLLYGEFDVKVLMALGACYQAEQHYQEALVIYEQCAILGMSDLEVRFYRAECLLKIGRKLEALEQLRTILGTSEEPSKSSPLLKRVAAYIELIEANEAALRTP